MANQSFQITAIANQADSTAVANTTTPTSIIPTSAKITLPNMFFNAPGKAIEVVAYGRISNIVTTPGTLTLDVRLGSVVAFNGGAMTLNPNANTNVTWKLYALLVCRSIGSGTAATVLGTGEFVSQAVTSTTAQVAASIMLPATAPAAGTGFDSTSAQPVDLFATWSIANAGNSITLHNYVIKDLN